MIKINQFKYKNNGKTIIFKQTESTKGEIVPKFYFYVENDLDLTNKILMAVKTKKVKETEILRCVQSLFQIIEKGKVEGQGPIIISESYVEKGAVGKEYYKINLIHTQGLITKTYSLYGGEPIGAYGDWKDIFLSGEQEWYYKFLKENFEIEIPELLINSSEYSEIKKFSLKFIFKEKEEE